MDVKYFQMRHKKYHYQDVRDHSVMLCFRNCCDYLYILVVCSVVVVALLIRNIYDTCMNRKLFSHISRARNLHSCKIHVTHSTPPPFLLLGLYSMCYARKQPYYYNSLRFIEPWLHVTYFIVGYVIGDYYPKAERKLVDDINEMRAEKGLMPLVGTAAWVRYQPPDASEDGELGTKRK
jgi:hypothetical protein